MLGQTKVLVCDDQQMIHETLREYIEAEGFSCVSAFDGEEAMQKFNSEKPDFVVLDLMMPKINGLDVCREIRKGHNTPIIILTAKGEEIDRIIGLELGADDYIVKPFSPREVVARIKVVLRRVAEAPKKEEKTLRFPGLQINISNYEVHVDGEAILCTPKEVELLYKLCSSPGRVYTREQLLSEIWGYDYYGDTRTVDVHITKLRKKLNLENYIKTVYKLGYRLEV